MPQFTQITIIGFVRGLLAQIIHREFEKPTRKLSRTASAASSRAGEVPPTAEPAAEAASGASAAGAAQQPTDVWELSECMMDDMLQLWHQRMDPALELMYIQGLHARLSRA